MSVIIFVSLAVKGIIKINQEEGSFLQKNSYTMVYEKEPETGQLSEKKSLYTESCSQADERSKYPAIMKI
jgi:hypothetical protein